MIKLTFWGRPKNFSQRMSPWDVFRTFLERFSKTERYAITNFLVFNTHIWWTKTENITTEIQFVLLFKIDVLETSQERHPPDVALGRL